MRKLFYILICAAVLTGCSDYQKVLKGKDPEAKVAMIEKLYEEGRYKKTLPLFEQIISQYRGTDRAKKLSFMYANSLYQEGDYITAAYQFRRHIESYPGSKWREEAFFKHAKSHYYMSPRYSKDQTDTSKALNKLQEYVNFFPQGEHLSEANDMIFELREKLDRKRFEIAHQYYHTENYPAAIEAFTNFIEDHPGSTYQDDAHFYLADAQYKRAIKSFKGLVMDRLKNARASYLNFVERYPESPYIAEKGEQLIDDIEREINLRTDQES